MQVAAYSGAATAAVGGALDVLVVRHSDGTLRSTDWHVVFETLGKGPAEVHLSLRPGPGPHPDLKPNPRRDPHPRHPTHVPTHPPTYPPARSPAYPPARPPSHPGTCAVVASVSSLVSTCSVLAAGTFSTRSLHFIF